MRIKYFKKILKDKTLEEIISMHISWKIYLTNNQIEKVLELKNKKGRRLCLK